MQDVINEVNNVKFLSESCICARCPAIFFKQKQKNRETKRDIARDKCRNDLKSKEHIQQESQEEVGKLRQKFRQCCH